MLKQIAQAIASAQNILILPHKNVDGDCLGSAFGLKLILERLGKNARVLLEEYEKNPRLSRILFGFAQTEEKQPAAWDMVIAVDSGDLERLGGRMELFSSCANTVNIDHHNTNPGYARLNFVDKEASSTGEIIFALARELGVPMDREIATNLYIAIASDTGRFAYGNTGPGTHRVAAALHACGIDHTFLNEILFDTNSLARLLLMRDALNSMELHAGGKIAFVSVTKEQILSYGATDEDAGGLIDLPRSLEGVSVAASLRESLRAPAVKVSLRSADIDVSRVAQLFGGGGHVQASGCSMELPMEEAKSVLLGAIEKAMEEGWF